MEMLDSELHAQVQPKMAAVPQQNYNSESDEEQYEVDGFSDEPTNPHAQIGWIQWFCALEGHEFLCDIDEDFIRDPFNLEGLNEKFTKEKLKSCIKMVLTPQQPSEEDLNDDAFLELNQEASDLYSVLHARYILSPRGLAKVYQKFLGGVYGTCPRALCDKQKVLPVGLSDALKMSRFKLFCPRCEEVYVPKARQVNIDGAAFGTSFPHVFLKHYPMAVILPPKIYYYEPKIYGFKIAGKRGSTYFQPPKGNVKIVEDSLQGLELEQAKKLAAQTELPKAFESQLRIEESTEPKQEDRVATEEGNARKKNRKRKNKQ